MNQNQTSQSPSAKDSKAADTSKIVDLPPQEAKADSQQVKGGPGYPATTTWTRR